MPELPEVETLRLQLNNLLPGLEIRDITIFNKSSFIGNHRLLVETQINRVRRIAKMLIFDLSNHLSLVIHLKMTGQLLYRKKGVKLLPDRHTRVKITFSNGDKLYFNDARKLGWMKVMQNAKLKIPPLNELINSLGPDPLNQLTLKTLSRILRSSRKPIKLLLMDQSKIAGIGNIYANEALFLSSVYPLTAANLLKSEKIKQLLKSLKRVLTFAIKWKGASRRNFRDIYGQKGNVQDHFLVYDREGKPCINCGAQIKRVKLSGRSTFYCPVCQN